MKIEDIKNKLERATIAVATIKEDKPHLIIIMYAKVKDGRVIITNNFMKTTIDNLKINPYISIVFWEGEKGWRIDGKADYHDSGKWFDFVKKLKENKEFSPKGAIVINVEDIRELG
jgi:uncharacterized protein